MIKFMSKCQHAMPILTDVVVLVAAGGVIYTLWNINDTINRVALNMDNMATSVAQMNNEVRSINQHIGSIDTQFNQMNHTVYGMNNNVRKMNPFRFMPFQ